MTNKLNLQISREAWTFFSAEESQNRNNDFSILLFQLSLTERQIQTLFFDHLIVSILLYSQLRSKRQSFVWESEPRQSNISVVAKDLNPILELDWLLSFGMIHRLIRTVIPIWPNM